MSEPLYPEVAVQLSGADGNAMDCGSYDAVLQLAMRTVNVS